MAVCGKSEVKLRISHRLIKWADFRNINYFLISLIWDCSVYTCFTDFLVWINPLRGWKRGGMGTLAFSLFIDPTANYEHWWPITKSNGNQWNYTVDLTLVILPFQISPGKYTVPVKRLDTPTHSRVFLYFYYFLHCGIIAKEIKKKN